MATRESLQTKLEAILGSRNVYYQPPSGIKMSYPCIRYSKEKPFKLNADDKKYYKQDCYQLILISRTPDNPVVEVLESSFDYCTWDNRYIADNLYHDVLTLYY
ncbi:MAG: hypothetical protein MJZ20_01525 [Bacteroidaceae bacterium]|nr:hypothetical protein [Bacteroidaceae bacterium]